MNATPEASFNLDCLRLEAARSLPAQCFDDFQRLTRTLIHGPAFQWLLVDARHELLREQVINALDKVLAAAGLRVSRVHLDQGIADVASLEAQLVKSAAQAEVVHVIGAPGWFDAPKWDAFNVRRERIATNARARLVFWLDAEAIALASQGAPDLWAWRSGVYSFNFFVRLRELERHGAGLGVFAQAPKTAGVDNRNKTERYRRIGEIRSWMDAHPDAPEEMLIAPLDELGRLLFDLGDYDAALAHWQQVELPFYRRRGAERDVAITQGRIADIVQARGQRDEALRIRREEQLPVFERLGDVRSYAVTQVKIAEILQARGQLDEALYILRKELLPVFERLGDVRSCALTQGKIADILQARGQLQEALSIRRTEELPVFERLGDMRESAITQSKIADILQAHGQLDEALRILCEELLPVFERLGDMRSRAVMQGRIADILQERGQMNDALCIRRNEELPVFKRLGDVHECAITQSKIAGLLQASGQLDEALRLLREEVLPVFERLGDVRERAIAQGHIADILQASGQLDEALRIRREDELPIYERLGDARSRAVCQVKIARALQAKSPHNTTEVQALMREAEQTFTQLGLPEADWVAQELRQFGRLCHC